MYLLTIGEKKLYNNRIKFDLKTQNVNFLYHVLVNWIPNTDKFFQKFWVEPIV